MSLTNVDDDTLKSDSHFPKKMFLFASNESPLKMTKNTFYFMLNALEMFDVFALVFALEIFTFLP